MKDRIKKIMEKVNLSATEFADSIDINSQTFNAALNRNQTVNTPIVQAILNRYEDISAEWLLMGKGYMMKGDKAYLEPDLFASESEKIEDEVPVASENRKEMEVKKPLKESKKLSNQPFMGEFVSAKKIDKIVVFFSDNTFITLNPEE